MTCSHHLHRRCCCCCPWRLRHRVQFFVCLLTLLACTIAAAAGATPEHLSSETTASSANSSTCSRSKHVVLASFGEPEIYHTVSLHFASKFPDTAVHHLWLHLGQGKAEETSNNAIHRKKTATDWHAFYQSHGIHRSVVDMSSIDDYHKFRRDYVHSSVNGYEYELLCFARFIGLRDFCTSKGIDQLTWIDADIPIFDPNFLDKVCLPRGYSIWALTCWSSFLSTMTCAEIGRFVDFMLDFYARENRHALVRAIQAHGSNNMAERFDIMEQVRRVEPAFAELGIDPKHFSDMFLFSKFLQDANVAMKAVEAQQEKEKKTAADPPIAPLPPPPLPPPLPRIPQTLTKAYIHQDENGGTIDPYFLPIFSIRNDLPQPEKKNLCVVETVWNRYYSVRHDDLGAEKEKDETATTRYSTSRLGLSFNQNGTWIPIAGAHFQGEDCKARLLDTFLNATTQGPGPRVG